MTARERVAAFLLAHQSRRLCDECLAHELGIDPSTAYRAAVKAPLEVLRVRPALAWAELRAAARGGAAALSAFTGRSRRRR